MPGPILTIQLFGPFEARLNGRVLQLEKRDSGRLLAYLILNEQPVVQRTLEETFWPGNLRDSYLKAIGQLRKELVSESERLEQVGQCLGFEVAGCEIDYVRFREGYSSADISQLPCLPDCD